MGADVVTGDEPVAVDEQPTEPGPVPPPRPESWPVAAARVSGLVLAVVVPAHLALTHLFSDPADDTVPRVLDRWSEPGWRVLECLVAIAVAVHVVAVTAIALGRSGRSGRVRTLLLAPVAAVAVGTATFACAVVLTARW